MELYGKNSTLYGGYFIMTGGQVCMITKNAAVMMGLLNCGTETLGNVLYIIF